METSSKTTVPDLDDLVDRLRDRIHQGAFVPGQRLIEADLVTDLRSSRSKVREALRRLESEGLVQIDRNRGASVRRISRAEVANTFDVLRVVSMLMADRTIDRLDEPAVRKTLEDSLAQVTRFRGQLSDLVQSRQYMNENARFWEVFAKIAGNPVLVEVRMILEMKLFRLALEGAHVTAGKDKWVTLHEDILAAILRADRPKTQTLVNQSVVDVRDAILALPDNAFG